MFLQSSTSRRTRPCTTVIYTEASSLMSCLSSCLSIASWWSAWSSFFSVIAPWDRASRVRICSGFSPRARIISLIISRFSRKHAKFRRPHHWINLQRGQRTKPREPHDILREFGWWSFGLTSQKENIRMVEKYTSMIVSLLFSQKNTTTYWNFSETKNFQFKLSKKMEA